MTEFTLYFTSNNVLLLQWQRQRLQQQIELPFSPEGQQDLAKILQQTITKNPIKLVVDIAEEIFINTTIPHTQKRDRRLLLERLINKHCGQYDYHYVAIQGRQTTGRRDDIVLLSALTDSAKLQPWLQLLQAQQIPLVGCYSAALLGTALLNYLPVKSSRSLLIYQPGPNSLRLAYYQDKHLQTSRLVQQKQALQIGDCYSEIWQTQRYIQRHYQMDSVADLTVCMLVADTQYDEFTAYLKNQTAVECHLLRQSDVLQQWRQNKNLLAPSSHLLIAQLAQQQSGRHYHYAKPAERRLWQRWRQRSIALLTAVSLLLLASLGNALLAWQIHQQQTAYAQTQQQTAQYAKTEKNFSNTTNQQLAVAAGKTIQQYVPTESLSFLYWLAQHLDKHPAIHLQELSWTYADIPVNPETLTINTAQPAKQQIHIRAEILEYGNQPEQAIAIAKAFIQALNQDSAQVIHVTQWPFALAADEYISGNLQNPSQNNLLEFDWEQAQ